MNRSNAVVNFTEEDPFDAKAVWLNAEHIRALPMEQFSRAAGTLFQAGWIQRFAGKASCCHTADPRAHQVVEGGGDFAADFFFLDKLPPYDPAELIPQKRRCRLGAPRCSRLR